MLISGFEKQIVIACFAGTGASVAMTENELHVAKMVKSSS